MAHATGYTKAGLIDLAIDQLSYLARNQGYLAVDSRAVTKRLARYTKQQIVEHIEAEPGSPARLCELA